MMEPGLSIKTLVEEYRRYKKSTRPPQRVEVTQEIMDGLRQYSAPPDFSPLGATGFQVPVVLSPDLPSPGWRIVFLPPDSLYDEDGVLIAVKAHGHSRYAMLLEIEDGSEWALDDCKYLNEEDEYVLSLSEVRKLTEGFKEVWYRPTDPTIEADMDHGEYGMDTWWPCPSDHPEAIAYTSTGLGG